MNSKISIPATCITVLLLLASYLIRAQADYASDLKAAFHTLSDICRPHARGVAFNVNDASRHESCTMMRNDTSFKTDLIKNGCTDREYKSVKDVVCYQQDLLGIGNGLADTCKSVAFRYYIRLIHLNRREGCRQLKTNPSFKVDLIKNGCTEEEYMKVKGFFCGTGSVRNLTDYDSDLQAVFISLSYGCKLHVYSAAMPKFKDKSRDESCKILKNDTKLKTGLIKNGCTNIEYKRVQDLVCYVQDLLGILNSLSNSCKPVALETRQSYINLNRMGGCKLLKDTPSLKDNLTSNGCTEKEYETVQDFFCGTGSFGNVTFLSLATAFVCSLVHLIKWN